MRTLITTAVALVLLTVGAGCGNSDPAPTKVLEGNRGAFKPGGRTAKPGAHPNPPPPQK